MATQISDREFRNELLPHLKFGMQREGYEERRLRADEWF